MIQYRNDEKCKDIISALQEELFHEKYSDILYYLKESEFSKLPESNPLIADINKAQYEIDSYAGLNIYKDENKQIDLINRIVAEINKNHGTNLKYAMWLADIDIFTEDYDIDNIRAFETSDIILSDDEDDNGCLYAYETVPKAIKTPDTRINTLMLMVLKHSPVGSIFPIMSDNVKIFNDTNNKSFTKDDVLKQHRETTEIEDIDIQDGVVTIHICDTNLR